MTTFLRQKFIYLFESFTQSQSEYIDKETKLLRLNNER